MMRREAEIIAAFSALVLGACVRSNPQGSDTGPQARAGATSPPMGDVAGPQNADPAAVTNPLANDPAAIQRGHELYAAMNCTYCHGVDGGGLIGPSLRDEYWRFGAAPAEIYASIADGRSKGMPAWRDVLPASDIWALTVYIQSFEKSEESAKKARGHEARE